MLIWRSTFGLDTCSRAPTVTTNILRSQVVAVAAVATCATLPMFLVGALGVQLRSDLGIELAQFGLLSSVYYASGVCFAVGAGWAAEVLGSVLAMRFALILDAVLLFFLAAIAATWWAFAALLVIGGIANALAQPSTNLHLAVNVSVADQGRAFGIKQSSVPMAALIGGLAVPTIGLTIGWRYAFAAGAVLSAGSLTLVRGPSAKLVRTQGRRTECSTGMLVAMGAGAGLGSSGAVTLGIFMVSGAVEIGIAEGTAGIVLAVASLASIAARVTSGFRVDSQQTEHLRLVGFMMLAGVAGFALLATGRPSLYTIGAVGAFCFGWGWPAVFILSVVKLNPSAPGFATSITQAGAACGSVIGPMSFGRIADSAGFSYAWLAAGCSMGAGAVVIGLISVSFQKNPVVVPDSHCRAT
jgi:predicted MFS family arabinose efflux permease